MKLTVFLGRHTVFLPEDPGKMVRGMVSGLFRDFADLKVRMDQAVFGFCHFQSADEPGEAVSGMLPDQSTQISLTIMKKLGQSGQRQ